MPAIEQPARAPAEAGTLCGKWMPIAKGNCARIRNHGGPCRSAEAVAAWRRRSASHDRVVRPEDKARWAKTYKLSRYGLSAEKFSRMLAEQDHACAMCHKPFQDEQNICIDHDHSCHPQEKRACSNCVRGLLCRQCNTTLGHIEKHLKIAQAYLARYACAIDNRGP